MTLAIIEEKIGQLTTAEDVVRFATAGNATLTLKSRVTGNRLTYKLAKPKDAKPSGTLWFVSYLFGPDNESDFKYLGLIRGVGKHYVLGEKSAIKDDSAIHKAFSYMWKHVTFGEMIPNDMEIWHAGRCCVCGRKLTVPESVAAGIGPECSGKVGSLI